MKGGERASPIPAPACLSLSDVSAQQHTSAPNPNSSMCAVGLGFSDDHSSSRPQILLSRKARASVKSTRDQQIEAPKQDQVCGDCRDWACAERVGEIGANVGLNCWIILGVA